MIPSNSSLLSQNLVQKESTSQTYKMNIDREYISSYCDGTEAMKQAIYKIINTERYQYIIYSWNYGIELLDLFGQPVSLVCPELERRIKEALTNDLRILAVDTFTFDTSVRRTVFTTFTAHTLFGAIEIEKTVKI